jgi:uncharacterized protein YceH (UPF0502 family)
LKPRLDDRSATVPETIEIPMSSTQTLIQATLSRLSARLGTGLMDAAAGLTALAQDAPDRVREEIRLFWEEVEAEAQRLEQPRPHDGFETSQPPSSRDPQERIDQLRARIAQLSQRLDPS